MAELRFDGRVAIVTGAGGGLGRSHALLLGGRGARVVVNDLGGSRHGSGQSATPAERVVEEIRALGGEAVANYDSVEDGQRIVAQAIQTWGRIDIVVNNAGILRDTTFHKMTQEDWDLIYRVHVLGGFRVTHAAWPHMREAGYGRVIFTASAAGIYGNFGQANYSMAKLGLLGLANTLALEGRKRNILVNTIAPIAGSRLTETVLPKELLDALKPEYVSPLVGWLCHERCEETGGLFEVGGGFFAKLRFERTRGKSFALGKDIAPELVETAWPTITDFTDSTHPQDVTASMQPVMENLSRRSRGGNEFIDVDAALGYEMPPVETRYTERDLALYALGVGAGRDPLDEAGLRYVYELHPAGFLPLPTYSVVPVVGAMLDAARKGQQAPGLNYGFDRILHGEQFTEVLRPLKPQGALTHKIRVKEIWDKGKHALVVMAAKSYDEAGQEVAYNEIVTMVRGAGGWGGERGPSVEVGTIPERAPDAVAEQSIGAEQALLYRLSGDWNPLHADPNFARAFGFPKPILHGLCTFGYAARHVIERFCENDARRFRSIRVRFAGSVYPGETLVTEMWQVAPTRIVLRARVKERDALVLSNAEVELFAEPLVAATSAPSQTEQPAAAATSAAAAPQTVTSGDVFRVIGEYVAQHPELVGEIGTVFQFKLMEPESHWTIDLKHGAGKVSVGHVQGADVTLELGDTDFLAMTRGAVDPQKLYFGGKLKLSGNIMASQKLMFLKKIAPPEGKPVQEKPAAAGASALTSGAVFTAIGEHVAQHPELVGEIGTVFQFKLTEPESHWTIDLKHGAGKVSAGHAQGADVTLELGDADFLAMTRGAVDPQKLYFGGKLKLSGNIMASQKLMFLKNIAPPKGSTGESAPTRPSRETAAPAPSPGGGSAPVLHTSDQASKWMAELKARLAETPALGQDMGMAMELRLRDAQDSWGLDFTAGQERVQSGRPQHPRLQITLDGADLGAWLHGTVGLKALYQQGKARLDGEIRVAHALDELLRGILSRQ